MLRALPHAIGLAMAPVILAAASLGGAWTFLPILLLYVGGVAFFATQSALAFSLVEIINYIEHYGLTRREIAAGQYERVMPWHSWDSSHRVSNWLLVNLARHADHHVAASKRYQVLHALDAAPQ